MGGMWDCYRRGRSWEASPGTGAEGRGVEGAEKTWGELCLFSATAPWQRRCGHKAKEFALCRFSISEGAAGLAGWGQGVPAPSGRSPCKTLGASGVWDGEELHMAGGWTSVPSSCLFGDWKLNLLLPCPLLVHQALADGFVLVPCVQHLWVLKGQSRGPQGHARGLQGGSAAAPCPSPPTLPHQCQTHAPCAHFPMPQLGLACSGGIPSLSSLGSSVPGKVLEPQGDQSSYRLLIGTPRRALLSQGAGTWLLARLRPAESAGTRPPSSSGCGVTLGGRWGKKK